MVIMVEIRQDSGKLLPSGIRIFHVITTPLNSKLNAAPTLLHSLCWKHGMGWGMGEHSDPQTVSGVSDGFCGVGMEGLKQPAY